MLRKAASKISDCQPSTFNVLPLSLRFPMRCLPRCWRVLWGCPGCLGNSPEEDRVSKYLYQLRSEKQSKRSPRWKVKMFQHPGTWTFMRRSGQQEKRMTFPSVKTFLWSCWFDFHLSILTLQRRSPSHLHGAALRLHEAAGGDVGPAAAGRQEAVLLFKPRTLKVRVVGETATLQLGQKTHTAEEHERTAFNGWLIT